MSVVQDLRHGGVWIDKSYLCQLAAAAEGLSLLWHKIAVIGAPGTIKFGRPGCVLRACVRACCVLCAV